MSLIIPDWVEHHYDSDDKKKRQTIYSLDVHPDGSRLATGGLDQKIRIWATDPILYPKAEADPKIHKLLCTLSRHAGSVLAVRWSQSGRFLASGSDDTVAMIWDLDPSGLGGSTFGSLSDEVNIESWRPHRRLAGHESDVVDLAWSRDDDDSYLATVGLDSRVIIWSGPRQGSSGFDRLKVISNHQGFVKGVVWDPIGQYLATASDDKSVKFWRIGDWSLQQTISKPFERSPTNTFFQRPSWSPDGAHIICSNAMSGPVFVASVVNRKDWTCDIHLVGHENTVIVAAFSPRLFRDRSDSMGSGSATVFALGSADQSVSIWITGREKPILVARDVFQRQVMDLSWSSDGLTLYASSTDGHIATFVFTVEDITETLDDRELLKAKEIFGFTEQQRLFRHSTLQHALSTSQKSVPGTAERPTMLVARKAGVPMANKPKQLGLPLPASGKVQRLNQQITLTSDGKRRIRPTLIDDGGNDSDYEVVSYSQSVVPAPAPSQKDGQWAGGDKKESAKSINGDATFSARGVKRNASLSFSNDSEMSLGTKRIKDIGRTLGGDLAKITPAGAPRPLRQNAFAPTTSESAAVSVLLRIPELLSIYKRDCSSGTIEARNYDGRRPSEIFLFEATSSSRVIWMDFSQSGILTATTSEDFSAVAFDDCSLAIYSCKGRRTSSMQLPSHVYRLECYKNFLIAITVDGLLRRWNIKADTEIGRPISVLGLLSKSGVGPFQSDGIVQFWVHSNGLPIIMTRSESAFTLDERKVTWVSIASGWFADCSPIWEGRTRGRGASMDSISGGNLDHARKEPIKAIESEINDMVVIQRAITGITASPKPPSDSMEEFNAAITLRHFEMRLQGAALLESVEEYKAFLRLYAKKLSDEGIRNQAEDLCRSLLGPLYFTQVNEGQWKATICGLEKRQLLFEVLKVMSKGRLLLGLVQTYQDLLRNVTTPW